MKKTAILCGLALLAVTAPGAAPGGRTVTLQPTATGTLAFFPFLDILRIQGGDLQSTCFVTTETNLEWRRSFVEFDLPVPPNRIEQATLAITETRGGWTATPVPTYVHEVSAYPADLAVEESDYDVPTRPVGTIETDGNDNPSLRVTTIDVTTAIRQIRKGAVGFRIKLAIDPDAPCVDFDFAGSDFGGPYLYPPLLTLEIRRSPGRVAVDRFETGWQKVGG